MDTRLQTYQMLVILRQLALVKVCQDGPGIIRHFTNQWRRQYLLGLRESHSSTRTSKDKPMKVGDVVILRDELTKWVFRRLGIVTELLTGKDGLTRAAIVKTVNSERTQLLRRSVKHLIPVELKSSEASEEGSGIPTEITH